MAALDSGRGASAWPTATAGARLASPWGTIERSGDPDRDRAAVVDAVREVEAMTVVVGLPLSLSGEVGPAARAGARRGGGAARAARAARASTVETADERFTTVEAERSLRAAGRTGKAARKVVDSAAAMVLLQAWLDRRDRPGGRSTATATGARADGADRPGRRGSRADGGRVEATCADGDGANRRAGPTGGAGGSARVRRRRRIVLPASAVALVVIVLAFVLWYELESHALGSAGPQVVVTVHQGESIELRRRRAVRPAGDRQLAGLPDLRRRPRHARPCCRAATPCTRT